MSAGWPRTRLDRVATVNARIGWKALTASEYQDEGYAFLATPNIKSERIDFTNVNFISEHRYHESPELKLREGDVLLAKDGSTLGIANVVRELPVEATVNGSVAVVRPFGIDARYLMYVLRGHEVQEWIAQVKDGMGVPHLFQADIKKFWLRLPPVSEQRRIADFLDGQVARIDNIVSARIAQRRAVLAASEAEHAARVEGLMEDHPTGRLSRFYDYIEQGSSPEGYATPAEADGYGVLKTSAVQAGRFLEGENKLLPGGEGFVARYEIRDGDVLVIRGSGSADLVADVAEVRLSDDHPRLMLSDLTYRLVGLRLDPAYAVAVLLSAPVRGQVRAVVRQGSGPAKVRGEDIAGLRVPVVSGPKQRAIAAAYWSDRYRVESAVNALTHSVGLLQELKSSLITAAVTGEFDVSSADGSRVLV